MAAAAPQGCYLPGVNGLLRTDADAAGSLLFLEKGGDGHTLDGKKRVDQVLRVVPRCPQGGQVFLRQVGGADPAVKVKGGP